MSNDVPNEPPCRSPESRRLIIPHKERTFYRHFFFWSSARTRPPGGSPALYSCAANTGRSLGRRTPQAKSRTCASTVPAASSQCEMNAAGCPAITAQMHDLTFCHGSRRQRCDPDPTPEITTAEPPERRSVGVSRRGSDDPAGDTDSLCQVTMTASSLDAQRWPTRSRLNRSTRRRHRPG